jgi:hypothetical protein
MRESLPELHKRCVLIDNSGEAELAAGSDDLHVMTNQKSNSAGNAGDV